MPDQIRISNSHISIGLNAASGAFVELVNEVTGENLIKNRRDTLCSPLSVLLNGDDGWATLFDGANPDCRPQIHTEEMTMVVEYPALQGSGGTQVPVKAQVHFRLDENKPRLTLWASITAEAEMTSVRFPTLNGMWLGQSWKDNVLVTPFYGGEKIENPVETISTEHPETDWKWQDYAWPHTFGGPSGRKEGNVWVRKATIAGGCSAPFVDLYGGDGGVYLALEDKEHGMRALRIETGGCMSPGIGMGFEHPVEGRVWQSPVCVIELHEGCWREAVDLYRGENVETPASPAWFRECAGLVTHYDFQYQSGEIVHRFDEVPELYRHTQEQGLDNIMLAGWHEGGFDRGFPCYRANTLLGGHEALRDGVRHIRSQGGHVTFYVNSRLCNTAYPEFAGLIREAAARTPEGEPILEQYGSDGLTFACMSPQKKEWRQTIVEAARYLVDEIGADGLYLDQLSAASPKHGYGSGEELDGWNRGCRQLLQEVREAVGPDVMILIQGVSQSTGPLCDGMLTGSLSNLHSGGFTALFRYLQPEQVLVNMMVPRKFSAMQPEPVAMLSSDVMDRTFVEGSFAWIYDLEGDNTFRLDPPQHERLRKMLLLRKAWLTHYGLGRYRDEDGVTALEAMVRRFELSDGSVLLACANTSGHACPVKLRLGSPAKAVCRTVENPEAEMPVPTRYDNGFVHLEAPADALCVIHLFKESGECE